MSNTDESFTAIARSVLVCVHARVCSSCTYSIRYNKGNKGECTKDKECTKMYSEYSLQSGAILDVNISQ